MSLEIFGEYGTPGSRPPGAGPLSGDAEQVAATGLRGRLAERRRRLPPGRTQITVGLILLLPIAVVAIAVPWLAPHDPNELHLFDKLLPPAWMDGGSTTYFFGTDHLGRDILSRVMYGARVSMFVGVLAVVGSGIVGVTLGLVVGYYRRLVDGVVMGIAEVQQSFPFLALAIVVVAVIGRGLVKLVFVLMIGGWILFARVVRGETMSIAQRDFVDGARALGASDLRIMFRHILPNVRSSIVIMATFSFAWFIIAEASLSFLGLGVDPSMPSWGQMMSDSRNYLAIAWWYPSFPGLALVGCVLGANLIGDGLHDRWDPFQS